MLVPFGRFGHRRFSTIPVLLCSLAWLVIPVGEYGSSAQQGAPNAASRMRLVAAPGLAQGIYRAAAEIELVPAAITYWRQPGDAGVPPKFSFAGSENVASAVVLYPAPSRINEDGLEAFGYRGGVVFPIHVTPKDAAKPAVLKVAVDYAVCERICVPARADAEIEWPTEASDAGTQVVTAAEARVPALIAPNDLAAKIAIAPVPGTARPTWTLTWRDGAGLADLFVEAPTGWYFDTQKIDAHQFTLVASDVPADGAKTPVDIRVTATGEHKSYEFPATLAPPLSR
jgi:DsbC/DsbD-like thiol-disulfide interchange protein